MTKTLRTLEIAYEAAKAQYGTAYPSIKWPKNYTIAQLIGIWTLKQMLNNIDYRDLEDVLKSWWEVRETLEIKRVIDFSNINRWLRKVAELQIEATSNLIVEVCDDKVSWIVADDTTGLKMGNCSSYFSKRTGRKQTEFWKLGISVDVNSLFIYGMVTWFWPSNDIPYWNALNKKTDWRVWVRLKDKWFDGWDNVHDITDVICRWWNIVAYERFERDWEVWLSKEIGLFWYRRMVETVYSVIKRKFWEVVRDLTDHAKRITMLFKWLAYNARLAWR
jgi:hypothetical protein